MITTTNGLQAVLKVRRYLSFSPMTEETHFSPGDPEGDVLSYVVPNHFQLE